MQNEFRLPFFVGAFFMLLTFLSVHIPSTAYAQDSFKIPDCAGLEKWSSVLPIAANYTEVRDTGFIERRKAAVQQLLSDEVMISFFGVVNGMWEHQRNRPLDDAVYTCTQALIKNGNRDAAKRLTQAHGLVGRPLSVPRTKN